MTGREKPERISRKEFAIERDFVKDLERRATEAILQANVLVDMRDQALKDMIISRIGDMTGQYPSEGDAIECVFNFTDGPETVRIEGVRLPLRYGLGNVPRFRGVVVVYRTKLKSGKWSKLANEVDAVWAIEQLARHLGRARPGESL